MYTFLEVLTMRASKLQWVYALALLLLCQFTWAQEFPKITLKETKKVNGKDIQFVTANGVKAVVAPKGETSLSLSENLRIKHKTFLISNDMLPSMALVEGKIYYLESKRKTAQVEYHTAQERETLWDISQMYGVRLSSLMAFNRMRAGEQPQAGRVIWMAKKRPSSVPVEIKPLPMPKVEEKRPAATLTTADTVSTVVIVQPPSEYYMTQAGQTITQVAQKHGLTEDSLYRLNPYISRTAPPAPGTILRVRPAMSTEQLSQLSKSPSPDVQQDTANRNKFIAKLEGTLSTKPGRKSHLVLAGETLQSVANQYRLSPGDIVKWNDLRESTLKAGQILYLEPEIVFKNPSREEVIAALDSGKHIVLPGQTIASIAGDYGVGEKDIIEWNKLDPKKSLKPGQRLYIDASFVPVSSVPDTKLPVNQFSTTNAPIYHSVAAGEGLWSIANRYKVKVTDVQSWNNLKGNDIRVGQKLIVGYQAPTAVVQQPASASSFKMPTQVEIDAAFNEGQHIVLPNETPGSIAAKYNVKVEAFCQWNNITPTTQLTPGQRLYYDADAVPAKPAIPASTASVVTTSPTTNISKPSNQPVSGGFEPVFHKVASGEGLWRIANTYKTTTVEIRKWNSIPDDQIRAGQTLVVGTKKAQPQFHKVAAGETLQVIAQKYNLPEGWLIYLNGGTPSVASGANIKIK